MSLHARGFGIPENCHFKEVRPELDVYLSEITLPICAINTISAILGLDLLSLEIVESEGRLASLTCRSRLGEEAALEI